MNREPLAPNQSGLTSFALLFILVLGIFIMWELNESITYFPRSDAEKALLAQNQTAAEQEPICLTGITDDCNDSNDVFLLPQ